MDANRNQGEVPPSSGGVVPVTEAGPAEGGRQPRGGFDPRSSPATYLLVGINCAVFLWMVLHGVSITRPNVEQLMGYGAMTTEQVLNGQWYRLITSIFVHGGVIHLGTNMWCLWNLGLLGEPLVGVYGMVAVYLLTGISGNLLGMAIRVVRGEDAASVGASGAVFGIAGILIVLLSNKRLPIPWEELRRLRRSVIQFAVINLILGGATAFTPRIIRIDNSAHIGGFLFGLALGVPLVPRMTWGRRAYLSRQKATFLGASFLLALFGYWISRLA
jgi:rhomboid protease GluP